jgi:glycosyltransferase involved in cell wall biosynthesis
LQEFKRYAEHAGYSMRGNYEAINLPGQFGEQTRGNGLYPDSTRPEIRILCVSTLEPRKNHLRLLQAYQTLRERRPELPLRLVLVGNRYLGAPEIADHVKSAIQRDSSIEWNGIVDDSRLAQEFNRAAFTVYASVVEGYGLPILESLWMGRPCLTHHGGVMLELAAEGGCVTADMNDVDSLTQGMERLATDPELRAQLSLEATKRRIKSWEDYGSEVAERLVSL